MVTQMGSSIGRVSVLQAERSRFEPCPAYIKKQIKIWVRYGITYAEIGKRLKTSAQRIHQIAKELGIKSKRSPKNYDEKILKNYGWENINKLAEIYNVNNQNIYYQLHKYRIKKRSTR